MRKRKKKNKYFWLFLLILTFAVGFLVGKYYQRNNPPVKSETVKVTRVIDGDTIEIEGGQRVRYIGINTPETVDPRKTVECFGVEASKKNKELVEGKTIRLEKDVSDKDIYGRLLRYVYAPSTSSGQVFINLELVKQGYAKIATFPPDVKYASLFLAAEQQARKSNLGLWSACQ